jgi:dTDP-4-dehydrorhamnose reductase
MRWKQPRKQLMMVTGAHGFLGRHLVRAAEDSMWDLFSPTSAVLDVRDRGRVLETVEQWKPTTIVHLAYRRDDRRVIIDGSRHIAEAAAACGSRLIHVSTDVVFGGREQPYTELDTPDATQGYGLWKARAEEEVARVIPSALLLRTSLLYGSDIVSPAQTDVIDALDGRTRTVFFTDEFRCPAHAGDVAAALLTLAQNLDVQGPLHLAGPEPLSRADLAAAFARWTGDDPAELTTGPRSGAYAHAARPGTVVLDSRKAAGLGLRCRPVSEVLRRPTG